MQKKIISNQLQEKKTTTQLSLAEVLENINSRYSDDSTTEFVTAVWNSEADDLGPAIVDYVTNVHAPKLTNLLKNLNQQMQIAASNYEQLATEFTTKNKVDLRLLTQAEIKKVVNKIIARNLDIIVILTFIILTPEEIDALPDEDKRFQAYYLGVMSDAEDLFKVSLPAVSKFSLLGPEIYSALHNERS